LRWRDISPAIANVPGPREVEVMLARRDPEQLDPRLSAETRRFAVGRMGTDVRGVETRPVLAQHVLDAGLYPLVRVAGEVPRPMPD
jgi:hypothetical protein